MDYESEYYGNQMKRNFQRNLTHLRHLSKFKSKDPNRATERHLPKSMLLNVSRQELQPIQEETISKSYNKVKVQDLKTLLNKMAVRSNVKRFIKNLKQFKNHDEKVISNFESVSIAVLEQKLSRNVQRSKFLTFLALQGYVISDSLNLFIYLLTLFGFFYINLISTFQCFLEEFRLTQSSQLWVKVSQILIIVLIAVKIITSCIIQTNENGFKMTYIIDIIKNYIFSTKSIVELLLLVSIILMFRFNDRISIAIVVYLISMLRLIILERIDDAIARHLLLNFKTKQYYSLLRLLLANFFLAHFFGTIFLALAAVQSGSNWITNYEIQQAHWFQQYVFSVYWATTITTTVGFGDIVVQNYKEAAIVTIVMLIGCLILSYNISQVANIFNNLMDRRDQIQAQLFNLNVLAKVARIDQNLHKKIADYLVNSFQIKFRFQEEEAKELLSKLPQNLRQEFMEHYSHKFFSQMPFFYILKTETKKLLIQKANMSIIPPNQHVTRNARDRHGFRKVFALRFGQIGLGYKKRGSSLNGHIVDKINVDIGDNPRLLNAFLLNRKRKLNYSIICLTFCNIISFQFDEMRQCMQQVPYDFQLWRQLYDSDKYLSMQLCIKKCQFCDQYHSQFNCPKLVYIPLRAIIYRKKVSQKHDELNYILYKNNPELAEMLRNHFLDLRQKKKYVNKTPLKFWKRLFAPLQRDKFMSIQKIRKKVSKKQSNPQTKIYVYVYDENENFDAKTVKQKRKIKQGNRYKIRQFITEEQIFQVDVPYDFQNYFPKCNPKKLVKIELVEYEIPETMYRMALM